MTGLLGIHKNDIIVARLYHSITYSFTSAKHTGLDDKRVIKARHLLKGLKLDPVTQLWFVSLGAYGERVKDYGDSPIDTQNI